MDRNTVRTEEDANRVVRQQRERGFDFVKLHGDLGRSAFEAVARAGIREGIPIVGHAQRDLPFSEVLRNRQAAVTHAEELIYTEFMSLEEEHLWSVADAMSGSNTWLTPGLVTFRTTAEQWGSPEGFDAVLAREEVGHLPEAMRRRWGSTRELVDQDPAGRDRIFEMLDFHEPLVRTFHEAGVPLLAGTDAGVTGIAPGFALHDELEALGGAGLTPHEALATATHNAGRFVRQYVDRTADFGSVREGARADLLLVDDDPRSDLGVVRRPAGVMLRGQWLDRAALDALISPGRRGR